MTVTNERRNKTVHNCCEARPSTSTRDGGVTLIYRLSLIMADRLAKAVSYEATDKPVPAAS